MTEMSYSRAVALGLREAMEADESVFCFGEDIAEGGAYGATRGLKDAFGPERVRDTPISEAAIVGFGVGAAVAGMRPVAEIMHMDFVTCAMDQMVNQAAKMRYMFGGKATVPMVVRCGVGGWLNAAAQHSQSLEAWFTHVPGLKVACASTPRDVRSLVKAAIRDDNPVVLVEPLAVYQNRAEVPDDDPGLALGVADIKRTGDDVTIVAWGAAVPMALEAADTLAGEGVEAEVVDLISLQPWDVETVLESVARTNRAVIAHQASQRGGFGAEVAAVIAERGFEDLDGPVLRVGARNVPLPFSPPLEEYALPNADRIADAVRALV